MTNSSLLARRTSIARVALVAAVGATLLLLPAAAAPAMADHGHGEGHHGRCAYGRGAIVAPRPVVVTPPYVVAPRPIGVRYYGPAPVAVYPVVPSPYVVLSPGIAGEVVFYPASPPVVYAPGYYPPGARYEAYPPARGVHGSFSVRIGF
jgi:hypothetical protein